jgi:hypothetical protein
MDTFDFEAPAGTGAEVGKQTIGVTQELAEGRGQARGTREEEQLIGQ